MQNFDIREVIKSTQSWLLDVSALLQQRELSERSLQCLLGLWICNCALDCTECDGHQELASIISKQLSRMHEATISAYNSKLLLLALYIVTKFGKPAFALEDYGRRVANGIHERAMGEDDIGEFIILSHLGLTNGPCSVVDPPVLGTSALNFLWGNLHEIGRLNARICAGTHFGTRACPSFPQRGQLAFVIQVLLIDTLNKYDLATGAMLLRAANYLGVADEWVLRDAQSFLQLQQLSDGRFGQYDMQGEPLRDGGLEARLDLYLPLTLSCLWALAETAIPSFRVFSLSPLQL